LEAAIRSLIKSSGFYLINTIYKFAYNMKYMIFRIINFLN
jgi:hypothetical protein